MDEGRCRTFRKMLIQPASEWLDSGYFIGLGAEVAFDPALHLATEKAIRMSKFGKSRGMPIDGMYLYQCLNHRLRNSRAEIFAWGHCRRKGIVQHYAFAPFHYIKGGA